MKTDISEKSPIDCAMTENEFLDFWKTIKWPEIKPVFYRLYYDDDGLPLFYSQEDLPGKCINITPEQFVLQNMSVQVVDKKLTYLTAKVVCPLDDNRPLDIIFLSNNETNAQQRYDRLCSVARRDVKWISGINNREHALKAAAEASSTKFFFLFPAKLYADENFDFDFHPIRNYAPKHYIFYAKNPVNDLIYGHQAAVCYNRQLVLDTVNYGLDFTMGALHDIVPVISGVAEFNSDIIMTWRTAFRESIKLRAENSKESIERLKIWCTIGKGKHCEWSLIGAQDGIEYYNSISGDHNELMKTFSWAWLEQYYNLKYKN
jgi:hypothetical protein